MTPTVRIASETPHAPRNPVSERYSRYIPANLLIRIRIYLGVYYTDMGIDVLTRLLAQYTYIIMAPAAMVLGPIVSLVAGVLLRLDIISLVPTCLALAAGELGADVVWYWVGRRYGGSFVGRFGRYFGMTPASIANAMSLFGKHHDIIIFTSKLTAGLGFAMVILFAAGLSRVPFRRYMMLNIAGQFLWTAALLSIGYSLGHLFTEVSNVFEKTALIALVVIILVSLIGFGRYLKSWVMENPTDANHV